MACWPPVKRTTTRRPLSLSLANSLGAGPIRTGCYPAAWREREAQLAGLVERVNRLDRAAEGELGGGRKRKQLAAAQPVSP